MRLAPWGIWRLLMTGLLLWANLLMAQDTLRGRVLDRITLGPLQYAAVVDPITGQGTISDAEGNFTLPFTTKIHISLLGYEPRDVAVGHDQLFIRVFLESAPYSLGEVVVSSIPSERSALQRSSATVGMMDKRDLDRDNGSIITPALNRIAGIYMHSGALNTNRITIRGIGARTPYSTNKVRAYLSDIPLTSGSGETTIEDVDLDFIDRVEVIKGPSSSMFGSGLGGTILLYPSKPPAGNIRLTQKNTFGSWGLFRNTTGVTHSGEKTRIGMAYNKTHSDGYRENNAYDRSDVVTMLDFYPNRRHTYTLLALYIDVKAYIPSSIDSMDFVNNPSAAAPSWKATRGFEDYRRLLSGISHQYDIRRDLTLKTAVFGGSRNNYELRPFNVLKERNHNLGLRSFLKYTPVIRKVKTSIVLGGEYFNEKYAWNTFENNEREPGAMLSDNEEVRMYYNLFLQSTFHLTAKLSFHAGLNMNSTTYNYSDLYLSNGDQSGNHRFQPVFSPRIAVSYDVNPGLFLYGNISHGFSPPGLEETLTPEGVINPELQPETGWNFEIGLRGELFKGKVYYEAAIYSMQIDDLLVARRVGDDQYVGVNAGKTDHNGIEALLRYTVFQSERFVMQVVANGTFTDYTFEEFVEAGHDYSGNRLPGSPRNTVNAGIDVSTGVGLFGNVNFQFIDAMPLRDDNSVFSTAYSLLNLKAGYKQTFFDRLDIEVSAGVNNMLDEQYASMHLVNANSFGGNAPRYYYPGLPVNYFLGLALAYRF
jgi:iron complex outermembrane receptor protein